MAKQRTSPKRKHPGTRRKSPRKSPQNASPKLLNRFTWVLLGLIVLTFIAYLPAISAGFVNWDDKLYVSENEFIRSLSWENIVAMFSHFSAGNYHPLTIFSFALNYQMGGMEPTVYHGTNILFHLLDVGLVLYFMYKLTNKNLLIAAITAFFFAIHPMHVESVAWISSRKDVLYVCFFVLGLIYYLKYLDKQSWKQLVTVGIFCVLACLSKPAAVVFPFSLMLIDYFKDRKLLSKKVILEKVPFFLIAAAFGLLTLLAQDSAGAVDDQSKFSFINKILFASYSLMTYLYKAFIPLNQACYYPYPDVSMGLSWAFYVAPLVVVGVAVLGWMSRKTGKAVIFGLLFFLANLLLVLQLLTVGGAIMAERYTYVPYIGLFFIVATGFSWLWNQQAGKWKNYRIPAAVALGLMAAAFTFLNFQQAKVWTNGGTLWTQAISSFPVARCYGNRADYYKKEGQREKALPDLNKALEIKGADPGYLLSRGTLLFDMGRDQDAINDFVLGLQNSPDDEEECELYVNMGSVYGRLQNYPKSLESFNQALAIDPNSKNGLINRGILLSLQGKLDASLADYEKYLEVNPLDPDYRVFNGMGSIYFNKGQHAKALPYFTQAIETGKADAGTYMNRSQSYFVLGDKANAIKDAKTAQQKGHRVTQAYFDQLGG